MGINHSKDDPPQKVLGIDPLQRPFAQAYAGHQLRLYTILYRSELLNDFDNNFRTHLTAIYINIVLKTTAKELADNALKV